jgi:hypothetical protein
LSVPIIAAAFSTLAQARTHLNMQEDDVAFDDTICEIINAAAQLIQDYTGRTLHKTSYAHAALEGTGETTLYLPEYPVTSISELKYSATREFSGEPNIVGYNFTGNQSASDIDAVADLETGELTLVNGDVWPEGVATVRVSYIAGHNPTSSEGLQFLLAELLIIADLFFSIGKDPSLVSSSMGGIVETYAAKGINEQSRAILFPHRRPSCVA